MIQVCGVGHALCGGHHDCVSPRPGLCDLLVETTTPSFQSGILFSYIYSSSCVFSQWMTCQSLSLSLPHLPPTINHSPNFLILIPLCIPTYPFLSSLTWSLHHLSLQDCLITHWWSLTPVLAYCNPSPGLLVSGIFLKHKIIRSPLSLPLFTVSHCQVQACMGPTCTCLPLWSLCFATVPCAPATGDTLYLLKCKAFPFLSLFMDSLTSNTWKDLSLSFFLPRVHLPITDNPT